MSLSRCHCVGAFPSHMLGERTLRISVIPLSSPLGKKQHQRHTTTTRVHTAFACACTLCLVLALLALRFQGSNSTFLPGPFPFSLHPHRTFRQNLTATGFISCCYACRLGSERKEKQQAHIEIFFFSAFLSGTSQCRASKEPRSSTTKSTHAHAIGSKRGLTTHEQPARGRRKT